tara:strand:- start:1987 stop:3537 length:1551 start_codon:yes stop_codon:yes gene_type:complete
MGIPSYFSHIIKEHRKIVQTLQTLQCVDNLYLDSNSIIYDIIYNYEKTPKNMNTIYNDICKKIDKYIETCNVQNYVIIAFDGVAPVAKLEQQRTRRFKTALLSKLNEEIKDNENKEKFDTTCITPGTEFMINMCRYIKNYYKSKKNVILSLSDEPGEGEHKIFEYIRNNKLDHISSNTLIYGLDADLIMLCLNHLDFCPNIYLYRETPEFIKHLDDTLEPNKDYLLNINMLADKLCLKLTNKDNFNVKVIQDYILLCFFLGNDFMPHFPTLNIRRNGIEILMETYNKCMSEDNTFCLVHNNEIKWNNIKKLLELIANEEQSIFIYETKYREKLQKRHYPTNTLEEKENKLLNIPIVDRSKEIYINPNENGWENRYYDICLHMERDKIRLNQLCTNYMEAIEWTYKYYRIGCQDWNWKYNYNYPPLIKDLIKFIPYFETIFIEKKEKKPIHPFVQLSYVLPPSSHYLLPNNIVNKLKEIPECFPNDIKLEYMFCRYIWEAHLNINDVEINRLKEIIV